MKKGKFLEFNCKISKNDTFVGNYQGIGSIQLEGSYEGILIIDNLAISQTGTFSGKIVAKSITVEGEIIADIETEKIYIKSKGTVEGDLIYRDLKIDEGGFLKSSKVIKMSDQKALNRFNAV